MQNMKGTEKNIGLARAHKIQSESRYYFYLYCYYSMKNLIFVQT